jgi:hypothetical protein
VGILAQWISDTEKQAAAQACRVAQHQAEVDAAKQSNPGVRATFDLQAKRYRELAAKLEAARVSTRTR